MMRRATTVPSYAYSRSNFGQLMFMSTVRSLNERGASLPWVRSCDNRKARIVYVQSRRIIDRDALSWKGVTV